MGGISTRRKMPAFATETFKDWWFRRPPRNVGRAPVMLWADTFNNHFHPQTLKAAVEVLEDAGFHVMVPRPSLCCGRPLYDFGMLDTAKALLRQILDTLRPEIEAGIPFVGLEPSCVAVFRDEMQPLPHGRGRQAALRQLPHAGRVPREEGDRLPRAEAPPQGEGARALPSHARHDAHQ